MFEKIAPNKLFDSINEQMIEVDLYDGKENINMSQFLDDVSIWMDMNRMVLTDKYLPFCVLAVGIAPQQVSAFMYGLFIGKALGKHALSIESKIKKMNKEQVAEELKKNFKFPEENSEDSEKVSSGSIHEDGNLLVADDEDFSDTNQRGSDRPTSEPKYLNKSLEFTVTSEIIEEVQLILANNKTGEEALEFLKSTEPVFMDEVDRFIQTELSRMRGQITETQARYTGSIIGAAYIAGFLIARNTAHKTFGDLFNIGSPI